MSLTLDGSTGISTPGVASSAAVSGTTGTFSGAVSAASLSTTAASALKGTATNDSAASGNIGEYVESVVSGVTVNTTATNVTTIALTAGDWDVSATFGSGTGGTNTWGEMSVSQASTTLTGTMGKDDIPFPFNTTSQIGFGAIPSYRVSLSGSATLYLVAKVSTATITTSCFGRISARRVR